MKLNKFIEELEKISVNIKKPGIVEVAMADYIPVVKPIFQDGIVFITDQTSPNASPKRK